jgi:predicted site-specific integrase-resolvase
MIPFPNKKYDEELAEDIMKILTCYSARFYGAKGGRKKKIRLKMSLTNLTEFKKEEFYHKCIYFVN